MQTYYVLPEKTGTHIQDYYAKILSTKRRTVRPRNFVNSSFERKRCCL